MCVTFFHRRDAAVACGQPRGEDPARRKETIVSQSDPQVFTGVTPAQYAILLEKAQAAGLSLSGNSGSVSKFGVEVAWNYSPETQELTLQCLRTPFFVSAAEVNARLKTLVTEALN